MTDEAGSTLSPWYQGPAFLMFVVLLVVYLVSAFSKSAGQVSQIVNFLAVLAVLFGLRAVTKQRRVLWIGLGLTLLFAIVSAAVHALVERDDYRIDTLVVLLLFTFMLGAMGRVVMRRERVTVGKIFAAACVYMLMGIVFGLLFVLIEETYPGSFTLTELDLEALGGALVHYSFTTLTTVGYGNISPVSDVARSLSDIEALIAQLFLAVVVARLVSLQITQGSAFDNED